ncbi:hypothetical protein B0H13DRAFT_1040171 [Mycena leptocephala]|nr:hypothetical protein B0H13DRAFT_1040171 [Mycena leptocephala]
MRFATFSLLALATRASALDGLTPCALNCITGAADATECKVFTNVTCTCTNADFQFKTQSCLTNECLAAELGAVLGLLHSQCDAVSLSVTATPTATVAFLPPNTAADISGSPSGSVTSSPGGPGSASKTTGSTSSSQTGTNERQPQVSYSRVLPMY